MYYHNYTVYYYHVISYGYLNYTVHYNVLSKWSELHIIHCHIHILYNYLYYHLIKLSVPITWSYIPIQFGRSCSYRWLAWDVAGSRNPYNASGSDASRLDAKNWRPKRWRAREPFFKTCFIEYVFIYVYIYLDICIYIYIWGIIYTGVYCRYIYINGFDTY